MKRGRKRRKKTRKTRKNSNYEFRSGWQNRHHILAKCRGGKNVDRNIIHLDANRHAAFHLLFGNRTFREAAALLIRVSNIKEGRHKNEQRSDNPRHAD